MVMCNLIEENGLSVVIVLVASLNTMVLGFSYQQTCEHYILFNHLVTTDNKLYAVSTVYLILTFISAPSPVTNIFVYTG